MYQADQRVVSTNTQVLQALLVQAFCILFSEPRQHLNSPCCLLKQLSRDLWPTGKMQVGLHYHTES